jgi:hypothetical protein
MDKLSVIATKHGGPGRPEKIGEIDRGAFHYAGRQAQLDLRSTHQLVELFGNGYGSRTFHLVDGNEMLVNCRMVQEGTSVQITGATEAVVTGGSILEFEKVLPAPPDEG